tara:strand:- start:71 stop:511 length:441 start_codon:yes stop_codon:yes gene_type:complete
MSTVKVDTIQTTGGVSEIAIDKLKGVSSANSISVVAEGGTTTTNLQQGLCKAWAQADSDATLDEGDSFNVSTSTFHSTGKFSYTLTNAMAGLGYSQSGCCRGGTDGRILTRDTGNDTASVIGVETTNDDGSLNDNPHDVQIVGDLA